jgi:hypothetical protein
MEKLWAGLAYTWRVFWNAIQFLIVLYVFSRLHARFEIVVVSILGLIYVTIRTIAFGTRSALANIAMGVDNEFAYIRRLTGADMTEREEAVRISQKAIQRTTNKFYIDLVLLSLISLTCLYQLFTAL